MKLYLLAVLALMLASCSSTTQPAQIPPGRTIAYDDLRFSMSMDSMTVLGTGINLVDGAGTTRLLIPRCHLFDLKGGVMLYASPLPTGSYDGLMACDLDGSHPRLLCATPMRSAILTDDGSHAVFVIDDSNFAAYSVETAGAKPPVLLELTSNAGPAAIASNDLKIVCYYQGGAPPQVVIHDLQAAAKYTFALPGSAQTLPFMNGPNLSWNSTTKQLLCSDALNVYVIDQTGALVRTVEHASDAEWSPDGTKMLWMGRSSDGGLLYYSNADGTNASRLDSAFYLAHWSPDSKSIVYLRNAIKSVDLATRTIVDYKKFGGFFRILP